MLKVLSLGAGVQSSTVLMMSIVGELDRLDCAIFADTQWEPPAVYRHLEWLETQAQAASIPIYRVTAGNIREDAKTATVRGRKADGEKYSSLPFHTITKGKKGILKRQCTNQYKIEPIEKEIRRLLGLKYRSPWPKEPVVEQWFGISGDEARRVRLPDARWKTHRYPLVFEKWMRRHDCLRWMGEHGFPQPPRSACIGCPLHRASEWRAIRDDSTLWADVVEVDEAVRDRGGLRGQLFLHRNAVPLVQIDFTTPEERGQMSGFVDECLGYCGN